MRASGIPAQYVSGSLPYSLAQQLILSMFPAAVPDAWATSRAGTQTSDPANDYQLLGETEDHYWFQFDAGSGMQDADPLMAGATIGQTFTTSTGTFAEVADSLREKTEVKLNAEIYSQAGACSACRGGLTTTTVLDQTFNDVDLVGRPLTIGNFVSISAVGALVFSSRTTTYSPYIAVGDLAYPTSQDEAIRGTDYQEVLTNFPLGSQILTGLFLETDLSGPEGPTETYTRALVDRIGYDVRQNGGTPDLSIDPNGPPALTPFDIFTVNVLPGLFDPAAAAPLGQEVNQDLQALKGVQQPDGGIPPEAYPTLQNFLIGMTRLDSANFFSVSDFSTGRLANDSLVQAYFDRPRIVIVSSQAQPVEGTTADSFNFSIDLREDHIRALAYPGQDPSSVPSFNIARGINENVIETNVTAFLNAPGAAQPPVVSTAAIFQAAKDQGVELTVITSENLLQLNDLNISAEAKARITSAVAAGKVVITPTRSVTLNGGQTVGWYEVDPQTGETVGVTEDGGHQGISEYAAVFVSAFLVGVAVQSQFLLPTLAALALCPNNQFRPQCKAAVLGTATGAAQGPLILPFITSAGVVGLPFALAGILGQLLGAILVDLVAFTYADPPLNTFLVSPPASNASSNLSGPNVAAQVVPDPLFTVPFQGAQLPTVFRIGINNTESTADTFTLTPTTSRPDSSSRPASRRSPSPPGRPWIVGICLTRPQRSPRKGSDRFLGSR